MRQPRYRKARRQALAEHGIQPVNIQRTVCVRVANTTILPSWLNSRLIPGLASVRGQYWMKRSDALALVHFFSTVHVWYQATEMEFKRCARCARPLLGREAEGLRKAMETVSDRKRRWWRESRHDESPLVCGPNCDKDSDSGIWRKLGVDLAA